MEVLLQPSGFMPAHKYSPTILSYLTRSNMQHSKDLPDIPVVSTSIATLISPKARDAIISFLYQKFRAVLIFVGHANHENFPNENIVPRINVELKFPKSRYIWLLNNVHCEFY